MPLDAGLIQAFYQMGQQAGNVGSQLAPNLTANARAAETTIPNAVNANVNLGQLDVQKGQLGLAQQKQGLEEKIATEATIPQGKASAGYYTALQNNPKQPSSPLQSAVALGMKALIEKDPGILRDPKKFSKALNLLHSTLSPIYGGTDKNSDALTKLAQQIQANQEQINAAAQQ